MATQTESTKFVLEGDQEYKEKLESINQQYGKLYQQLTKLKTETENTANAKDILKKKVELLEKAQSNQNEKVKLLNEQIQKAEEIQKNYSSQVENAKGKIEKTTEQQKNLGEVTEETKQQHEQLTQELQQYQQKLQSVKEQQEQAKTSIAQWKDELEDAQSNVESFSQKLQESQESLQKMTENAGHAAQGVDQIGSSTSEAADSASDFGERSTGALEALAANLSSSFIEFGISKIKDALLDCIDATGAFETAVANISTIADTNIVPLDDLKNSIVTLSSELGVSAGDVADSVYGAISSGIDTADAIGVVEEATKLAVGSFTDTTTAVDILSAAINAYGLESSQASQMSDYLITMQTLTKTSVGELAANMQAILPTAAAYNVQMDNLSGAYVIMAENGSSTAEATAYLESMLSELGDSGSAVSATLKESTGMSFETLSKKGQSLGDIMKILSESVNGDRNAFRDLWDSSEAGVGALSLLQAGTEKYNDVLEQMEQSTGATETAFGQMSDTVEFSKQKMENAFENLKVAIGDQLSPAIKDMSDLGADAFSWATNFVNDHPDVVAAIGAVVAGVGTTIAAIVGLTTVTTIATQVVGAFQTLIDTHPITLAITAIAALVGTVGAYIALADETESETMQLKRSAEELKEVVDETKNSYDAEIKKIEANVKLQNDLVGSLSTLIREEEKSAETKIKISGIVDRLNETIPGLALAYDRQTDSLNMTIKAIEALIEQEELEQEYQAAVEEHTELLEERAEASDVLREAEQKLIESTEAYNEANDVGAETLDVSVGKIAQLRTEMSLAQEAYAAAEGAIALLDERLQESETVMDEYQLKIGAAQLSLDATQLSLAGMSDATLAMRESMVESSTGCGELQEAIAALDEAYLTHTGELQLWAEEIRAQQESLREEHEATRQKIYDTLSSEMGMFEEVSIKGYDSVETMIGALDSQISFMDTYAANIQKAMELGVDDGIIKTLSDGSVDSAKILQAIVDDGGIHIDEFNEKFKKVEEGKKTFSENLAEIQGEFGKRMRDLKMELANTIKEMNKQEETYKAGLQNLQGFIDGTTNSELWEKLIRVYRRMALTAIQTAKNVFDQHSPSRKFHEIGQYNVIGAIQGTEAERPRLVQAYANTASAAIEAYNTRAAALMENMRAKQYAEFISVPAAMRDDREMRLPETSADPAALQMLERLAEAMESRKNRSGITQNVTIVNPEGTPAANARALRKVERGLAFGL